ncbi:MAG: LysR family transcriptional regulator, partial [Lachnospiraceae bacterium]|nr:LysR family transcriptional regulator [Lachnospiraceae bacterium]
MNLKQIEAFVKVANNRSFSQTAKELYLTQPTISAHISALEEELGVQLFVRTTKGVRVTEEGKKLYLYARQMTELEENIKTLFQKRGEDEASSQQVVIAASTIPAQY